MEVINNIKEITDLKKIHVNVIMEIDITDNEYNELERMAQSDKPIPDLGYNSIFVPDWIMNRLKEKGKIVDNSGTISGSFWQKNKTIYLTKKMKDARK